MFIDGSASYFLSAGVKKKRRLFEQRSALWLSYLSLSGLSERRCERNRKLWFNTGGQTALDTDHPATHSHLHLLHIIYNSVSSQMVQILLVLRFNHEPQRLCSEASWGPILHFVSHLTSLSLPVISSPVSKIKKQQKQKLSPRTCYKSEDIYFSGVHLSLGSGSFNQKIFIDRRRFAQLSRWHFPLFGNCLRFLTTLTFCELETVVAWCFQKRLNLREPQEEDVVLIPPGSTFSGTEKATEAFKK